MNNWYLWCKSTVADSAVIKEINNPKVAFPSPGGSTVGLMRKVLNGNCLNKISNCINGQ